jgi:hypothetical protein
MGLITVPSTVRQVIAGDVIMGIQAIRNIDIIQLIHDTVE